MSFRFFSQLGDFFQPFWQHCRELVISDYSSTLQNRCFYVRYSAHPNSGHARYSNGAKWAAFFKQHLKPSISVWLMQMTLALQQFVTKCFIFCTEKDGSTFIWIIRMTFYQVLAQDIVMPFRVIVSYM